MMLITKVKFTDLRFRNEVFSKNKEKSIHFRFLIVLILLQSSTNTISIIQLCIMLSSGQECDKFQNVIRKFSLMLILIRYVKQTYRILFKPMFLTKTTL